MKKIISILIVAFILIFNVVGVFAAAANPAPDDLRLIESNPKDGYAKVSSTNVMIKLFFSQPVSSEESKNANAGAFKFTNSKGEKVPFKIYYNKKDNTNICILADEDLVPETDYTVAISGKLVSDDGIALGADKTIEFTTRANDGGGTYMLLMVAMIVVMVVVTFREQKKKMEEENGVGADLLIQANPYKLAKEKNISVDEAVAMIQAEREKAAKRAEKMAKVSHPVKPDAGRITAKKPEKKVYKVKTKRITKLKK